MHSCLLTAKAEEMIRGGWEGEEVRREEEREAKPTYDNRDPLVNIGRRDGSWESVRARASARRENKDTRCSGTDNDRDRREAHTGA